MRPCFLDLLLYRHGQKLLNLPLHLFAHLLRNFIVGLQLYILPEYMSNSSRRRASRIYTLSLIKQLILELGDSLILDKQHFFVLPLCMISQFLSQFIKLGDRIFLWDLSYTTQKIHNHCYLFPDGWKLIIGYTKLRQGFFSTKFISPLLVSGDEDGQLQFFMRIKYSFYRIDGWLCRTRRGSHNEEMVENRSQPPRGVWEEMYIYVDNEH